MNRISRNIVFLGFCLCYTLVSAQTFNLPIDDNIPKYIEENYFSDPQNHTAIRPLQINILKYQNSLDSCFSKKDKKHWLFDKNFIEAKNDKNGFILNPVLTNISNLHEILHTENGINTQLWFGKNLSANLTGTYLYFKAFYFTNRFPLNDIFIPHFGKANLNLSNGSASYLNLIGNVSWQIADFMNLQVGRDKVFLGDGYRSLFISDNSNSYPYFKSTVDIWKVKYIVLFSAFHEKDSLTATDFRAKKYSASHFLSWNIGNRLNFNLFETVIWRGQDSLGKRGFDVNYLNPIIFYRPVEFSLGSPDNVIMGFGGRLRIFKTTHIYGQFLLDEFKLSELKANNGWWANKYGIQAGIKTYRFLGVSNLYALAEVNIVRPFTYSHGSYMENNGNYSQPLAHPLGANFIEGIGNLRYLKNRWQFNALFKKYAIGKDDFLNRGNDIYRSYDDNRLEYGNKLLQGNLVKINSIELSTRYILNPKWNLSVKFGIIHEFMKYYRFTGYFFGLSTNIGNREGLY